jgi:hypothetical protein
MDDETNDQGIPLDVEIVTFSFSTGGRPFAYHVLPENTWVATPDLVHLPSWTGEEASEHRLPSSIGAERVLKLIDDASVLYVAEGGRRPKGQ